MMSEIQMIYCDFSGSETTLTDALPYVTGKTLEKYRTFIYNSLGLDYFRITSYNVCYTKLLRHLSRCTNRDFPE